MGVSKTQGHLQCTPNSRIPHIRTPEKDTQFSETPTMVYGTVHPFKGHFALKVLILHTMEALKHVWIARTAPNAYKLDGRCLERIHLPGLKHMRLSLNGFDTGPYIGGSCYGMSLFVHAHPFGIQRPPKWSMWTACVRNWCHDCI